ncbi:MAG: hypothetical protein A2W91_00430 [Bacteroidetes bacterium GWF2_38_335]|nr:MAG: hypothetical protein A2W91_00430 [Bacteroidetes bacterium GWF2_38_335]OFY78299.1 MAG: hypothetical protein A2281_03810 [Bacteroidetes bacterium RIFOXYA12_FULL_38_20]HBS87506.1 hypothetical protein [Bacteroidales bacterium]
MLEFFRINPFIRILIPLITGIFFQIYIQLLSSDIVVFFLPILVILILISFYFINKRSTYTSTSFAPTVYLFLFFTGMYLVYSFDSRLENISVPDKGSVIMAKVKDLPAEKEKTVRTGLEIIGAREGNNSKDYSLQAIAIFENDSIARTLMPGDIILFSGEILETEPPKNPCEFSYKNYLYIKGITHQVFLKAGQWLKTDHTGGNFIYNFSCLAQKKLIDIFKENKISGNELAVLSALTLGYKDLLDNEVKSAYSSSGAMHILSVSGLHAGIIYLVLVSFLGFLNRSKSGRLIKATIIILFLVFFAFLTGLSPSVIRAVTMFSFITAGNSLGRKISTYNSLAASAFFLLLFNPYQILDVGFQLSYIAVFSIVFFQKPVYNLLYFKNKLAEKAWALVAVSVAAQIGTLPLTLYYFNQFPNYFIITNLVVIPLTAVILYLAIALFVFSFIAPVAGLLSYILEKTTYILNTIVSEIDGAPFSVARGIHLPPISVFLMYLVIFSLSAWFFTRVKKYLFLTLFALLAMVTLNTYNYFETINTKMAIIYSVSGRPVYEFFDGKTSYLVTDSLDTETIGKIDFHTGKNRIVSGVDKTMRFELCKTQKLDFREKNLIIRRHFISFMGQHFFVLNKESFRGLIGKKKVKVDYLIISENVFTQADELSKKFDFNKIIIDSSCSKYICDKWIEELQKTGWQYYIVRNEGAFIIEI